MNRTTSVAVIVVLLVALGAYFVIGNRRAGDEAAGEMAALSALDAKLAALEADVANVAAYEGIWENELQYTRGLDRHDETLIRNVFWSEAKASYGTLIDVEEL